MEDDEDRLRRMLGIKLIEAAREAGADIDAPRPPPPPPVRNGAETDDCDFSRD